MANSDLIRMERMTYEQKIDYWGRSDAFLKPDETRIRYPAVQIFNRSQVQIDNGNITKIPNFFGRPCFGIPTAYLRHFLRPPRRTKNGRIIESKCGRCQIADVCRLVATERLKVTKELSSAHSAFEIAGGTRAMWNSKGSTHWRGPWQSLKAALKEHGPFTSVNDEFVAQECLRLESKYRADVRKRKRIQREKLEKERAKRGHLTDDLLAALSRHRIYRRGRYVAALEEGILPIRFTKVPEDGPRFDTAVWQAKMQLIFRDCTLNPHSVAKEMIERRLWDHNNANSLRQRVTPALDRIRQLERIQSSDQDFVFPRITLAKLIKEITEGTPYED